MGQVSCNFPATTLPTHIFDVVIAERILSVSPVSPVSALVAVMA